MLDISSATLLKGLALLLKYKHSVTEIKPIVQISVVRQQAYHVSREGEFAYCVFYLPSVVLTVQSCFLTFLI